MRTRFPAIIAILVPLLSACAQPKDAEWQQALVGTWEGISADSGGAVIRGKTTYFPGGLMGVVGSITLDGNVLHVVASGTWEVKQGYLHYTVGASNIPDLLPVGFASADKIVSITGKELTYVSSSSGRTKIDYRVR